MLSAGYLKREGLEVPEYFALMLCSATGMMLMASANDLITMFLSLEILSIALYVLAAFDRRRLTSQEAGLKYFLLGSFSSAVFLYGIALVYGATGTTNLTGIATFLAQRTLLHNGVLLLGLAFLLVGLGFKVAAAPFHMWTPDVYQGAPTPVTAFMAAATKAAAFAAILRVFVGAFRVVPRRLAAGDRGARRAVAARRQHRRGRADRREAHARVLSRSRTPATSSSASRPRPSKGTSAALFYLLDVRGDDDRRVRGRDGAWPARATTATRSPTTAGSGHGAAGARRAAHAVPARAGGRAAHRRFRREAVGVQRGGRRRASTGWR